MSEMEYIKLKNACSKIGSGSTPKGGASVYIDEGTSLIRSQNVYNLNFSYKGLVHINEDAAHKLRGVTIKKNDILINITGDSVARTCIVPDDVIPARVNQHVAIIRPNNSILNPFYLNYFLASPFMQATMLNYAVGKGASRNAMTKEMIGNFLVPKPSIDIQKKIVEALKNYDNLIENNNKRIKLLEKMAENLYKEWFVRFRFPGYGDMEFEEDIPSTWKYIQLSDIISFERGISYSSAEINCDDGINLVNLKNIQPYGGFRREGTKKYNGKYKDSQIVNAGDLILGVTDMTQDRRTVGSVALIPFIDGISAISADLVKIISKLPNQFLYCMCRYGSYSKYFSQFANGANVLHLKPNTLLNKKLLLPPKELIKDFTKIVLPMLNSIDKLNLQNDILIKQRDLLLPRLMSGKLEV